MPSPRRCWLPGLLLLLAGCGDDDRKVPDQDLLLTIDGLEIRLAEVEPHVKFLDSIAPEWATRVKYRRALDEFVIPLRLAQRAFPNERAKLLERARHLRSVATNAIELEQQGAQQVMKRQNLTRRSVEIPVAMFLFDPLTTGGTSDPIEVPRGWIVASAYEIKEAALVLDDVADAVQVGFLTHSPGDWVTWLEQEQRRLADKVTYVHPDFREHLPEWIVLP